MPYDTSNYYSLGRKSSSRPTSYSSSSGRSFISSTYDPTSSYGFNSGYSAVGNNSMYSSSSASATSYLRPSHSSASSFTSSNILSPAMLKRNSLINTLVRTSNDLSNHHFISSDAVNLMSCRNHSRSYASVDRSRSRTIDLTFSAASARAVSDLRSFSNFTTTSSYGTTYRATYRPVLIERPTFINYTPRPKEEREKNGTDRSIRRDRPLVKFREKDGESNPESVRQLLNAWSPDVLDEQDEDEYDRRKRDSVRSNDSGIGSFRSSFVRGSCRKSIEFGNYDLGPTIDERDSGTEESEVCSTTKQDGLRNRVDHLTSVDEGIHFDGDEESRSPRDFQSPLEFQEHLDSNLSNLKTNSNFLTSSVYDIMDHQRRRRESNFQDEISEGNYLQRKSRVRADTVAKEEENNSKSITFDTVRKQCEMSCSDQFPPNSQAFTKSYFSQDSDEKIPSSGIVELPSVVKYPTHLDDKISFRTSDISVRKFSCDKALDLNVKEVDSMRSTLPKPDHSESEGHFDHFDVNNRFPSIFTFVEPSIPSSKEDKICGVSSVEKKKSSVLAPSNQLETNQALISKKHVEVKQEESKNTPTENKSVIKTVVRKYGGDVTPKKVKETNKVWVESTATASLMSPASVTEKMNIDVNAEEKVNLTVKESNTKKVDLSSIGNCAKNINANENIALVSNQETNNFVTKDLETLHVSNMNNNCQGIHTVSNLEKTLNVSVKSVVLQTPIGQEFIKKLVPSQHEALEKQISNIEGPFSHSECKNSENPSIDSKSSKGQFLENSLKKSDSDLEDRKVGVEIGFIGKDSKASELSKLEIKSKIFKDLDASKTAFSAFEPVKSILKCLPKEVTRCKSSKDRISSSSVCSRDLQTKQMHERKKKDVPNLKILKKTAFSHSKPLKPERLPKEQGSDDVVQNTFVAVASAEENESTKKPGQASKNRGKFILTPPISEDSPNLSTISSSGTCEKREECNKLNKSVEIEGKTLPLSPVELELVIQSISKQTIVNITQLSSKKNETLKIDNMKSERQTGENAVNGSLMKDDKLSTSETSATVTVLTSQHEEQDSNPVIQNVSLKETVHDAMNNVMSSAQNVVNVSHELKHLLIPEVLKESSEKREVSNKPDIFQNRNALLNAPKVSGHVFSKTNAHSVVPFKIQKSSSEEFKRSPHISENESSVDIGLQKSSSADLCASKCERRKSKNKFWESYTVYPEISSWVKRTETHPKAIANKLQKSSTTEYMESHAFDIESVRGLKKSRTHEFPPIPVKALMKDSSVLKTIKFLPTKAEKNRLQMGGLKPLLKLDSKTYALASNQTEIDKAEIALPPLSTKQPKPTLDTSGSNELLSIRESDKVDQSQSSSTDRDEMKISPSSEESAIMIPVSAQRDVCIAVRKYENNVTCISEKRDVLDIEKKYSQSVKKAILMKTKRVEFVNNVVAGESNFQSRTLKTSKSHPNIPERFLKLSCSDLNVPRNIVEKQPVTKSVQVAKDLLQSPRLSIDGNSNMLLSNYSRHAERCKKVLDDDLFAACDSKTAVEPNLLSTGDDHNSASNSKESDHTCGTNRVFGKRGNSKEPLIEMNHNQVATISENLSSAKEQLTKKVNVNVSSSDVLVSCDDNRSEKETAFLVTLVDCEAKILSSTPRKINEVTKLPSSECKIERSGKEDLDTGILETRETKAKKKNVKNGVDDKGEKMKKKNKKKLNVQVQAEEVKTLLALPKTEDVTFSVIAEGTTNDVTNAAVQETSAVVQHSKDRLPGSKELNSPRNCNSIITCTECKTNCHKKCEKSVPHLCGVNEKLLSQVLATVKKDLAFPSVPSSSEAPSATESVSSDLLSHSPSLSAVNRVSDGANNQCNESNRSDSIDSIRTLSKTSSLSSTCSPGKTLHYKKYTIDDFHLLKVLGRGSYGKVMLSELKGHNQYFAIKCLKKDVVLEDNDVECTMIEKKVLAMGTNHPYLCTLFCTFQSDSHLFFVMEYLSGGDLMFHIQQSGRFDQERAKFYAAEIVCALKYLHKRGIVYRDAKLDNICLDGEGHIRLVDFGFCKLRIYRKECLPRNLCGTPDYMAPEIIKGHHYNQSVDWWSFGVLLYEMLIGQSPFNGTDEEELFWSVCNEEAYYPRFISKEAKHLLALLLEKSPDKRLGMPGCQAGDICTQSFFRLVNWDKVEKKEVEPPFKPKLKSEVDVSNFDSDFTMEKAMLTPIDKQILASMDQSQFQGFSYTNPNITD